MSAARAPASIIRSADRRSAFSSSSAASRPRSVVSMALLLAQRTCVRRMVVGGYGRTSRPSTIWRRWFGIGLLLAPLGVGCSDGDDQSGGVARPEGVFPDLRDRLVESGNPLTVGDFQLQAASDHGVLLLKPDSDGLREYTDAEIEAAVELCDAVELPDGFTVARVFSVVAPLAEGRPGDCREGSYREVVSGASNDGDESDAELAFAWYQDYGHLIDSIADIGTRATQAPTAAELQVVCQDMSDLTRDAGISPPIPVQAVHDEWAAALLAYGRGALQCLSGNFDVATELFLEGNAALSRANDELAQLGP